MNKILAVVLLLVVAGAGGLYWIGERTERLFRIEAVESSRANADLSVVVTDYRRGLLGARARVCLHVDGKAQGLPPAFTQFVNHFCMLTDLRYGPLLFGPGGVKPGWAGMHSVIDVASMPEAGRTVVNALFARRPPLTVTARFAFDGSLHEHMVVAPFDGHIGQLHLKLGALSIDDMEKPAGTHGGRGYLTLRDGLMESPGGSLAIDKMDGDVTVTGLVGPGVPLMESTVAAEGVSVSRGGGPLLTGNVTMRIGNHFRSGLMDARYDVWFDGLRGPVLTLPIDSGYFSLGYRGLGLEGLKAVDAQAKRLKNLEREIAAHRGNDDADSVTRVTDDVRRMRRLLARMRETFLGKALQPGKTAVSMQLMLDQGGRRQLTLNSEVRYRGVDGKAPDPARLTSMGLPGWLRLMDANVHLNAAPRALPPALNARIPGFMAAGLVAGRDERLVSDLTLSNGALTVNGNGRSPAQLTRALSEAASAR